jgi:hypothetical protein
MSQMRAVCCIICSGATLVQGIEGVTKVHVNPHVAEVINFRNGCVITILKLCVVQIIFLFGSGVWFNCYSNMLLG